MSYSGMRWLKCDFQMQTPGDQVHWAPDDLAHLSNCNTAEESARMYLRRCHDIDLDVAAITDHNFCGRQYLEELIRLNDAVASELGRGSITIIPGFEVEVAQGLGVHLLCIFDPEVDLDLLDELLVKLELGKNQRADRTGGHRPTPKPYSEVVELTESTGGVVIAAHPTAEKGALNDSFITETFQQELFLDERLLAIEIPKFLEELSDGWQNLLTCNDNCYEGWRRKRPPALVMSSDCYRLTPPTQENGRAHIGKRFTWLKMSRPSIESVRQAFCDHHSRIRLQERNPDEQRAHDWISSLSFSDVAFLADQEVHFSPNLNCIIGGRGSGKSTIIEYLRLTLGAKGFLAVEEKVDRVRMTISESSEVRVKWNRFGESQDEFLYDAIDNTTNLVNRDVEDLDTVLRNLDARIISQSHLSSLSRLVVEDPEVGGAGSPKHLISLIDEICGSRLQQVKRVTRDVVERFQAALRDRNLLHRRKREKRELEQEIQELDRALASIEAVRDEYDAYVAAQEAENFLQRMRSNVDKWLDSLDALASKESQRFEDLAVDFAEWPASQVIEEMYADYSEEVSDFAGVIISTSQNIRDKAESDYGDGGRASTALALLERTKRQFIERCRELDLDEKQIERFELISEERTAKEKELSQRQEEIADLRETVSDIDTIFQELQDAWEAETEVRRSMLDEILINAGVPTVMREGDELSPFVEFSVDFFGNESAFLQKWTELSPKGNTGLGKAWLEIGAKFFDVFRESEEATTPWKVIDDYLNQKMTLELPVKPKFESDIRPHLLEDRRKEWEECLVTRIPDNLDIALFREDGSCAGNLSGSGLSDGQKNTAVLTLLLAEGDGPIIIDQPEDELDSAFIYQQLVPLVRDVRESRQVIFATHNANLPVSGDAEFIYALHTDDGNGLRLTAGALDRIEVKQAVLDIMEGSKAAFERRQEMYQLGG